RDLALILATPDAVGTEPAPADVHEALHLLDMNARYHAIDPADAQVRILVQAWAALARKNTVETEQRIADFEKALERQPAGTDTMFQFARLNEAAAHAARARALLLNLVVNQPDNPQFLDHYIRSQHAVGDLKEAATYLRKLAEREPGSRRTRELQALLRE